MKRSVKVSIPSAGFVKGELDTLVKGMYYPLLEVHEGNFHTPETMYTVALPNGRALTTYAWRFEPIQKDTD